MFVRSYSFHVSHQYTLHVIIIGGETTHRRCLVMSIGLSGLFLLKAGLVEHLALVQLLYKLKGAYPPYNIVHAGLRNLLCQCP